MNAWDWTVVAVYMLGMIGLSAVIGRRQASGRDYYLGGNRVSPWATALSTMATQCSTNSLLGAPAFVIAGGGLLWLQYELALPLAMVGVMLFLLPFFRQHRVISVYEFLEIRFGPGSRTLLSVLFQVLRAFATGVTVYGIALVLQVLTGMDLWVAVLLLGAVTVLYDLLGGIRAVIYSDVIQMVLLYGGIAVCMVMALRLVGGWSEMWAAFPADKAVPLDFSGWGLREGQTFTFWPMLLGGFFLYLGYYGCDQTQVQRELSTRSVDDTNMSLFINGLLRFPLVLSYCLVGVAIGAFLHLNPDFVQHLMVGAETEPNYNRIVPVFCVQYLPHGVIGLIMVSLFAAAMSSLDSTINSLSATTMRDIVQRFFVRREMPPRAELLVSRLLTVFWGGVCMAFSFSVSRISGSIIESINKISSLANGPILATFLLATLTRRANDAGVMIGIVTGFTVNVLVWLLLPGVSWLWWNVLGCFVTFGVGYVASLFFQARIPAAEAGLTFRLNAREQFGYRRHWWRYQLALVVYFFVILAVLAWMTFR